MKEAEIKIHSNKTEQHPDTIKWNGVEYVKKISDIVYEFLYNPMVEESSAQTMSIHKTRKGAEMAMKFHKEEKTKEWYETIRIN